MNELATTGHRPGPIWRAVRTWPSWTGWAAAVWSLGYGVLGLLWSLGVPGFPFGEGDIPDARAESLLGTARAGQTAPVIAASGLAGAVIAVLLARAHGGRVARTVLTVCGTAAAVTLLLLIPDQRPLVALAYAPIALLAAPFGLFPVDYFDKALPWPVVNLLVCQIGGLLWAGAVLAHHRRAARACTHCGRADHRRTTWARAASAARWGRVAAYAGLVLPLFYAVVRWGWALGIPVGISPAQLSEMQESGLVWAGAYLATFAAAGGVLVLGLTHRWGEIWPRWVPGLAGRRVPPALPITAATTVTVALAGLGGVMIRVTDWSDVVGWLSNPLFYLPGWAVAIGAATLAYHLRTRGRCTTCGRNDLPVPR